MEEILVSVLCITYNHELYIRDAIEGFLSQKTNFSFEIVIHDDASDDRTVEIIKEYENRYPGLIHGIYQEKNRYQKNWPNFEWLWKIARHVCRGKYIAFCDGDDFWIDNRKLQLEADFLETHPDYVMATHDAVVLDCRNNGLRAGNMFEEDCTVKAKDIIVQNQYMYTSSMLFRKEVLQMDDFFLNVGIGDYPCLLYALSKGRIYYFARIMSVYRLFHEGSWSHSMMETDAKWGQEVLLLSFFKKYQEYTHGKYEIDIVVRMQKSILNILESGKQFSKDEFFARLRKCEMKLASNYDFIFRELERLWMQLYDENYIDRNIVDFAGKYQKIYIMGAGKYAGIIAKQLYNFGISFDGFVVSNDQPKQDGYYGKPVWKMERISDDCGTTGVIVGINPVIWDEIILTLSEAGIKNYICPFLIWNFHM